MRILVALAQYALPTLALAYPRQSRNVTSLDPCGLVGKYFHHVASQPGNQTSPTQIPGQLAQDCLLSLPYDRDLADKTIRELGKYVEFQSSLELLKNPPQTYMSGAVDIVGGLKRIGETDYSSQYEFDLDLKRLFMSAHDGHFSYNPCSLGIFYFSRHDAHLVSVSKDGLALPDLYLYSDIISSGGSVNASPIASINKRGAMQYIETASAEGGEQDPDARWNFLMRNRLGGPSGFAGMPLWPGANQTTIILRDGSVKVFGTVASLGPNVSSTAFTTSRNVFDATCGSPLFLESLNSNTDDEEPSQTGPVGYPEPQIREDYNHILGFDLDSETAVMQIPIFGGGSNNSAAVAKKATEIITRAKASGRSRLIVDVSGNNGGEQNRYFDIFSLLFPDLFVYDALRIRRSDSTAIMAKFLASPLANDSDATVPLNYQDFVTPDQQRGFSSLAEFLGEEEIMGTKLTALHTVNFTKESTAESPIRGYGAALDDVDKTLGYRPEDVLVVTDGICHSSCAAFVDLLSHVAKVRTVVFGGRPQLGPMQGIGGVRGGNIAQFSAIAKLGLKVVSTDATNHTTTNLTGSCFTDGDRELAKAKLPGLNASFPLSGSVNFQNQYREDNGNLPLQFDYHSAECRLFFTADNVNAPATAWAAAKNAIWGGGTCVEASPAESMKHEP